MNPNGVYQRIFKIENNGLATVLPSFAFYIPPTHAPYSHYILTEAQKHAGNYSLFGLKVRIPLLLQRRDAERLQHQYRLRVQHTRQTMGLFDVCTFRSPRFWCQVSARLCFVKLL